MKKSPVFSVILAGGASSRLFPFNKILSDLTEIGKTLIQQAQARALAVGSKNQTYVLSIKEMVPPIRAQLKLSKEKFFVDPARRGTWPALLWSMAHLRRKDPDAVLAVLTADQIIPGMSAFRRAAQRACRLARENPSIVMLGVAPGSDAAAWTGFGVFRVDGQEVTDFSEKPTLAQSTVMMREGGWQWNSGMFFFRIATAEQALARFQPAMSGVYEKLCAAVARGQGRQAQALYAEFPAKIPHPRDPARDVDNSIDFAIMMPLVERRTVELRAQAIMGGLPDWTDLGQWEALCDKIRPDRNKNNCLGKVKVKTSERCILAADRGYALEVAGLTDAIVAVSARGLLILPRHELPRIKDHVARMPPKKFLIVNGLPGARVQRAGRRVVVSGAPFIR